MLNVGADWGEICLYVNISFLLIRELDLFIVQVNEIISVIPVNVNTTYAYVRYISACIRQVCDGTCSDMGVHERYAYTFS